MVISKLASGLQGVIKRISGAAVIDKAFLRATIKELQRTLISADVNVKLVLELSKRIEAKALSEEMPTGVSIKEHVIKTVYDELVQLMGEEHIPEIKPQKILLVGTYGHGKTTTASKIAKFYSKRGLKTGMVSTDTWRPAAYEQLRQLGDKISVPAYGDPKEKDALKILRSGLKHFQGYDVIIVDSAGRDSLNKELIGEIQEMAEILKPDETYLVLGADMGQTAGKQAREFSSAVGITGVIVTRTDSSAKGGGAMSACAEAGAPITFIGTGEKADDFEPYNGQKYISRLLGYPDLGALITKMKEVVEDQDFSPEDMLKGNFTLKAFYKQLEATKKMGSLGKIVEQLGMGSQLPDGAIEQYESKGASFKVIMDSMTPQELDDPDLIKRARIERIAKGSGRPASEVRELLKQFKTTKKMLSKFKKGKRLKGPMANMLKQFKGSI